MGSFIKLPKDVVWMIFQYVIIDYLKTYYRVVNLYSAFNISGNEHYLSHQMRDLACISRKSLALIKTKCRRVVNDYFVLNDGVLVYN